MKKMIIIIISLVAVLFFVWLTQRNAVDPKPNGGKIPTDSGEQREGVQTDSLTVRLAPQNNSGESGTATISPEGETTKVILNLNGAPRNIIQPAHIHSGSCADLGGVKYSLTFPRNGNSETIINIPMSRLLKEIPLAINVHKSANEISINYACGDLLPK